MVIIAFLILLSGFLSACETALTGVNRIRLKHKAEHGSAAAKKALKLLEKYDQVLATILIANNAIAVVAAAIATVLAIQMSTGANEAFAVTLASAITTIVLIVLADILPKTLAREHADSFALVIAGILSVIVWIFVPISFIMLFLQRSVVRIFRKKNKEVSVTEEELMKIIDEIQDEGVLEEHESLLVRSALEFDETTVEEILTPRVDMTAVALTDSVDKVRDIFLESGFSRLPVYDKSPDKIVGVISNKEFMRRLLSQQEFHVKEIMHDIPKIAVLMKLSDALKLMQREKSHLAVVLDQHGGTEGIVALEDILEELVGEIWDEGDEEKQPVKFVNENSFEVGSELAINDFNRAFAVYSDVEHFEIDSESNTVGGWVFELFGRIPNVGEFVKTSIAANTENGGNCVRITILSMEGKRIGRVRFEVIK
jgi:CBS domain containing-hemolysin-like protein